jgi:hypothetical protein
MAEPTDSPPLRRSPFLLDGRLRGDTEGSVTRAEEGDPWGFVARPCLPRHLLSSG